MDWDVSLRTNTCRPRFCWQSDPWGFPPSSSTCSATHTQRVWRNHRKPEGLILPPAHVIQTHLFKAIVVLFVWFLWRTSPLWTLLCLFCYCVRACVCVWRLWACAKKIIINKKWALRLWAIYWTYIPQNVLRCQYNHSKTAISRSEEWETYDSSWVCM